MARFPAMPLWTDAYLGDTTHLTTIEHGAYLLLLITAWRSKKGLLPDDDSLLARYTFLTPAQWKRMRPTLAPFFTIENGTWEQCRLTDELEAVRQHSRKASNSAKARWLKNKETSHAVAMPEECERNAPLTLTLTTNIIEDFEKFFAAYPRRQGSNPKKPASDKFHSLVKGGADPREIIAGAEAYALSCQAEGKIGTSFVAQAKTWLTQERWKDKQDYTKKEEKPWTGY